MGRYTSSDKARAKAYAKAKSNALVKACGVYHAVPPKANNKRRDLGGLSGPVGGKPSPEGADESGTPRGPMIPAHSALREKFARRRQRFLRRRYKYAPAIGGRGQQPTAGAEVPVPKPPPLSRNWRDFDPETLTGKLRNLATEFTTYRDRLDEILAHRGEYVVISGREIIGYAPDIEGAIELVKPVKPAPCLVKQVVEFEPVVHLGGVA